jgi:hypothetical protein
MFWMGPELGLLERACIRSVLRQGHALTLWCYDPPAAVPEGVTIADASAVFPESAVIRHRGGSVALFANRFRYELMRRGAGIWLDCDVYLLKPIESGDTLLVREPLPAAARRGAREPINGSLLRLPPDSPMLPPLLALFEEKSVPNWLPLRARAAARVRLLATGSAGLGRMPWGVAGPKALTAIAEEQGLYGLALPADVLHPFAWDEAGWIADPERRLEERATGRTIGVHLWNERIKAIKDRPAPSGSFLERLQEEGA